MFFPTDKLRRIISWEKISKISKKTMSKLFCSPCQKSKRLQTENNQKFDLPWLEKQKDKRQRKRK
jgi:hypothetical protein